MIKQPVGYTSRWISMQKVSRSSIASSSPRSGKVPSTLVSRFGDFAGNAGSTSVIGNRFSTNRLSFCTRNFFPMFSNLSNGGARRCSRTENFARNSLHTRFVSVSSLARSTFSQCSGWSGFHEAGCDGYTPRKEFIDQFCSCALR